MAKIAAILYPPGTDIDALLAGVARDLSAAGIRVGGVVQTRDVGGAKGMAVVDLGDGQIRSIAQNLGPLSTSCKLDTAAMAEIAGDLERQIDAGLDLLILSRFGKTEIDGGGFRSLFGRAMLAGTPLLTGVRDEHAAAWATFSGGLGATLPPDKNRALAWAKDAAV
ncbi:DUF2478 domain-containing protein [Pleomorphomonas sp. PLEO]|uniref:DUF2478 domain-containing protein n=1 Tax=Pleomorphomonas sp. PLEO TaxID=3239306 RepID=UPI00351EA95D